MLDPWILARRRLVKGVHAALFERPMLRRASLHGLTEAERAAGIAFMPSLAGRSFVVPNSVAPGETGARREPVLAYVGRIHPKKNLDALVRGWTLARDVLAPLGARLRIAGWGDEEHVAGLRIAIAAAGGDDIEFLGPVYGADKAALLGSARFLALPSHSEGLPMAILEAWAAGTPTLMSRHCHLPEGYAAGAAIDCGTEAETIAASLRAAAKLPEGEWQAMSGAAARLAREAFSPDAVARSWIEAYSGLLAAKAP